MSVFKRILRALELPEPIHNVDVAEHFDRGRAAQDHRRLSLLKKALADCRAKLEEARRQRAVPPQAYVNAEQIDLQRQQHELLERAADKQIANAREAAECAIKWLRRWRGAAHAKDEECTALRKDLAKSQALAASRADGVLIPAKILAQHHGRVGDFFEARGDSPQAALDALAELL